MTFADSNGRLIETKGDFAISKKCVSFFGFKIMGDVSINFDLDNNSEVRDVLNYDGPQMLNQVAWTRQPFSRMRNGNPLDNGFIVIESESKDKLNCYYVSGNSNWINLLTGIITDLDWSRYQTQITATNIALNTTEGLIFPYVDWTYNLKNGFNVKYFRGENNGDKTVDVTDNQELSFVDFYPCLYLHTLVKEILQQNGIKLAGNIAQDKLYQTLVVTPDTGQMKRTPFKPVIAIGSSQLIPALSTTKYTSFTTIRDPDGVFDSSSSSIIAGSNQSLYFTITAVSSTAFPLGAAVYKNGAFSYSFTLLEFIPIMAELLDLERSHCWHSLADNPIRNHWDFNSLDC